MNFNSGIASQIPYKIEFPDYNGQQLHQISIDLDMQSDLIYKLGGLSHGFYSPRNGKIDARCQSIRK
jgi:hypothetical protein